LYESARAGIEVYIRQVPY